ncbi:hypothetical protein [uncultured Sulfitobacter sp.]|uniref:hypothetical protein n=1 Tax=uncultured Sulfitobacter sp. TaxID=191468 RepID=UPI00262F62B0|nr:hypothetical protein [uncultured Sulfitobacter sp.]
MLPLLEDMSINTSAYKNETRQAIVVVLDAQARDPDKAHAAVYEIEDMQTARERGFFQFAMVGLSYAGAELFALGEWGEVRIFSDGTVAEETVDFDHGPLRNLATLDGQVHACGADLQVFRRTGKDAWEEFGPGDALRAEFPGNHLEMIDGFGAREIYAAGRAGVIWYYDGSVWTPVQTPTNLNYYAVHCGADGRVYLGGQAGVLAFGRGDSFEVLTPDAPVNDVWGVALFDNVVFMAGFRSMVLCNREEFIPDHEAAARGLGTFYDLHMGETNLWSFGMKDVMRRTMEQWQRLDAAYVV